MKKRIEKPWGHEEIWAHTDSYVAKVLVIEKGYRLSLQHHDEKTETMRLIKGKVILSLENDQGEMQDIQMLPGDCADVRPKCIHRITALEDSEIIEVSSPELDDVVRHEDDYGRN